MSTCNRMDLQTLGSQPIMPKNLDHWGGTLGKEVAQLLPLETVNLFIEAVAHGRRDSYIMLLLDNVGIILFLYRILHEKPLVWELYLLPQVFGLLECGTIIS